jgi:small subunit ribosomal protein S2
MLNQALQFVYDVIVSGKSILFVGTKKQAQQVVKDAALSCGQHYVTHRWLGGTLTNNQTIRRSVKRMLSIEEMEKDGTLQKMPKKEAASARREMEKLRRNLCGVVNMAEPPGAVFVVDINREAIAVAEANKLQIPVVAVVDTNCDPDPIRYVIPGNDDAIRAVKLVAAAVAQTVEKASAEYAKIAAEAARRRAAAQQAAPAEKPVPLEPATEAAAAPAAAVAAKEGEAKRRSPARPPRRKAPAPKETAKAEPAQAGQPPAAAPASEPKTPPVEPAAGTAEPAAPPKET